MKAKELGIWAGIIVVLIGGLWLLINAVNSSLSPSTPATITIPEISSQDFIKGPQSASNSAKVTLVEYADFQCPACGVYYSPVKQLEENFGQNLRVIYRFFPLVNTHKNSMLAAQTAYAAGLQGKFWEMHDLLFENQSSWSDIDPRETFLGYAKDLKLDMNKFTKDLDADSTKEFINKSLNSGTSIGINSTPTFFVNGTHIQNPQGYDAFKKIIQDEIDKK